VPSVRHQRWLESELPRLVDAGVIDAVTAGRVRAYYEEEAAERATVPLFAVLGAALVGLGIILLLAHNWEALSRPERAALSLGLLLFAQAIAGYVLWRRRGSVAWSEGSALFLVLASGATVALLGQTYQVPGDLRGFLSQWLLLALPVPYLFMARGAAALYLVGAFTWLCDGWIEERTIHLWWLWLAGVTPLLVALARREATARDTFLGWIAVPVIAGGFLIGFRLESWTWLLLYVASVVAGVYAAGAASHSLAFEPFYARPARTLGGLAIAIGAVQLGKTGAWSGLRHAPLLELPHVSWIDAAGIVAVGVACAGLALYVARWLVVVAWPRALFAALPLFVAVGLALLHGTDSAWPPAIVFNAYALAAGIGLTLLGMREASTGLANLGFLLLACLVFDRFVDFQLSYTLRGLSFIGLGIGFLLLNLRLRGRRRAATATA
jgi:hypothetical protein